MENPLPSDALAVNLKETRDIDVVIPDHHRTFLEMSQPNWSVHQRAMEAILEINHPYQNYQFAIDQLRKVTLNDFWFYIQLKNDESAFEFLIDIYDSLLSELSDSDLKELIILTLFDLIERLTDDQKNNHLIQYCLNKCLKQLDNNLESFCRCTHYLKKYLKKTAQDPQFEQLIFKLTKDIQLGSLDYWQQTSTIETWTVEKKASLEISPAEITTQLGTAYFEALVKKANSLSDWSALTNDVPSFDKIAIHFRQYTDHLPSFKASIHYTFYLLRLPGMSSLKKNILNDIDRLLHTTFNEIDLNEIFDFLDKIFSIFYEFQSEHGAAVLTCIETLSKAVINRDDSDDKFRVNYLEKKLIEFGFEIPGKAHVQKDWKIQTNENHIKNIRTWLEIIGYADAIPEKLLSALIINLYFGGVYISDTDLFQRDITNILHSNIAPSYKKIKQLTQIFPVYFNEIGAEGEIREVTTTIDELSHRNDRLIHFLRKQVHIEGNNTLIELTRNIFEFWFEGNPVNLKSIFPFDVYQSINVDSRWFKPVHLAVKELCHTHHCRPIDLLKMSPKKLETIVSDLTDTNVIDQKRIKLISRLYSLLKEKYSFETVDIIAIIARSEFFNKDDILLLKNHLDHKDYHQAIKSIYDFMGKLKSIILNVSPSKAEENIFHKRHVAFGIPSMFGRYHEPKFEALGMTFRLEKIVTRLIEKIIADINLDYISATTLKRIYTVLEYIKDGLEINGVTNPSFVSNLQMLKYSLTSSSFSLEQYSNIFAFMADNMKEIIKKYFIRPYDYALNIVIPRMFIDQELTEKERNKIIIKKSEAFHREMISKGFLIQTLDNFISSIISTLHNMVDNFSGEIINDIMSYNSDLVISSFHSETAAMDNPVFLGSKAYFLKKMFLAGFPVPPGFILTTEVFRRRKAISKHPYLKQEIERLVMAHIKQLEKACNKRFGDQFNPLLLSVRAGTAISMPGAMDTFLNVGINEKIVRRLSRNPKASWTAWDSYRRLIQRWGMAHGMHRDVFDRIMSDYKSKYQVQLKSQFTDQQMSEVALSYKAALSDNGVIFQENPKKQLTESIYFILDSWSSNRANVYRKYLDISEEWGTAVIIQQMVFGNLNNNSGTGVVFTHNPNRGRPGVHLYGDYTLNGQGEDVVSGLVHTRPVGETQRKQLKIEGPSLQKAFPENYKKLFQIATDLIEKHGFSHQEIEFTFESDRPEDLYILQTRNQSIQSSTHIKVFRPSKNEMCLIGKGIGISKDVMNGILAFSLNDLVNLNHSQANENCILVRPDTVPDDIEMIFRCDGMLTARGGVSSHAAVTAVKLGKVCIVNCVELAVNEQEQTCELNGHLLRTGDKIAIDGNSGAIYLGHYPIEHTEVVFDKLNKY